MCRNHNNLNVRNNYSWSGVVDTNWHKKQVQNTWKLIAEMEVNPQDILITGDYRREKNTQDMRNQKVQFNSTSSSTEISLDQFTKIRP